MVAPWVSSLLWLGLVWKAVDVAVNTVLDRMERRPAASLARLHDPVFAWLPRHDCTQAINWLQAAVQVGYVPNVLYLLLWGGDTDVAATALAFLFILLLRSVCIYLTPLEVPFEHIHLEDELQGWITRRGRNYDRDLFFSGHVSLALFCGLTYQLWPPAAGFYAAAAAVQAVLLLLSRVHYTVDVLVAPFISYSCCHLARQCVG